MFEHEEDAERQRLIESICSKCFLTESPSKVVIDNQVEMTIPEVSQMDKETIQDDKEEGDEMLKHEKYMERPTQRQRHIYFLIDSPSKKLEVEMTIPEVLQVDNETLHDRFRKLYKQKDWINMTEEELREALEKLLKEE